MAIRTARARHGARVQGPNPEHRISRPRILTGTELDRLEDRRGEPDILHPETRVLPIHEQTALLVEGVLYHDRLGDLGGDRGRARPGGLDPVLLGDYGGQRWAARSVGPDEAEDLARRTGGQYQPLRSVLAGLPAWQAGLVAFGTAILAWQRATRFCGHCGAPTRVRLTGHQRVCTEAACGVTHFPRTDPAIITLVRRGDHALLVHQPSWPPGRLSTLAGFVEPGESLEQAVVREVGEEVGLTVTGVTYYRSQPWPFPHTLMVGYRTDVAERDFTLGDELDDARWFDRHGLRAALAAGDVTIPPPLSLSRSLIEEWLEGP